MTFIDFLKIPHVKNMGDCDDRSLTLLHREILLQNRFLWKVYQTFYRELMSHVPEFVTKRLVELGSGAGFIKTLYPSVQTSDILDLPDLDMTFDGCKMPFEDAELDGILMINVLHHIKDVDLFFCEANRVLKKLGRIVMIEPANTVWGRFIYTRFHHEIFDPSADWHVDGTRPLLDANDALAWIIFERDREQFVQKYPALKIIRCYCHTPISYLLSGGFSLKQLLPGWMYGVIRASEQVIRFSNRWTGMFQTVVLEKCEVD